MTNCTHLLTEIYMALTEQYGSRKRNYVVFERETPVVRHWLTNCLIRSRSCMSLAPPQGYGELPLS